MNGEQGRIPRPPSVEDFLAPEQMEQLADILVRVLASTVDAMERNGIDPYTLFDNPASPDDRDRQRPDNVD